jgi:hypothetical protein
MTNQQQDLLGRAVQLHQSGHVREALDLYNQLLPSQPDNSELLCLLGIASLQIGQMKRGAELVQRAVVLNPGSLVARNNIGLALQAFQRLDQALVRHKGSAINPDYADAYCNWGLALQQLGRLDDALASYDHALAIKPDFADAYHNRGNVLQGLRRPNEALASYDKALAIRPVSAGTYHNRGVALQQLGRLDDALASFDHALAINPAYAAAYHSRGVTLHKRKRLDEALASYDKALAIDPDYADAYCSRGVALQELKRVEDALASFEKAIAIKPGLAAAHSNRGGSLRDLKRLDEALASHDRALAIDPGYAVAHKNRGSVLRELGRLDEALASFDKALALDPNYADAWFSKATLLLSAGRYLEGWPLYEWRLKQDETRDAYYVFPKPAWRGDTDIRGKKLLIFAEQGLGDIVQFCRYLPQLHALGAELVVEIPKRLIAFISTLDCPMTIVEKGKPLPAFDAYCPVMSLPYIFKTTVETIPADIPYLFSDAEKVRRWQKKLGKKKKPRVGLVWSGADTHKNDLNRSVRLKDLLPIIELPFIEWHSLQREYRPADLATLKQHREIRQHQDEFDDFSDTVALIECMDLVISVDTSVVHVTGAMGRPLWILLSFAADFRWMLEGIETPWYPTAKLYRQPTFDDWPSVFATVRQDLETWAKSPQTPGRRQRGG